jgi:transcriptional regulator with XRE-family HTH domain
LKLERIEAGVSLTDLAQALGLSIGHLSNIEAGKRSASPELIDRIRGVIRGRAAA